MTRNAAIIYIDPDMIVQLFSGWNKHSGVVCLPQMTECRDAAGNKVVIPDDAIVADAIYEWHYRRIGIRIEHPSLPVWEDGAMCPALTLTGYAMHVRELDTSNPDSPTIRQEPSV